MGRLLLNGLIAGIALLWRAASEAWKSLWPWLPSTARLIAVGALCGGCTVGVISVSMWIPIGPVSMVHILFVWGIGLMIWGIAAIAFIVVKVSASTLATMVYRLTDIANRPVALPETRPTIADTTLKPKEPLFRDPGSLANEGSSFSVVDDEEGYIRQLLDEARKNGIGETTIKEMLEDYQRERQRETVSTD